VYTDFDAVQRFAAEFLASFAPVEAHGAGG
jgi:hypothetical protein